MQELLDTLQQEKLALEQSILELQANTSQLQEQAQELRERERLLVFFPDLHMPTETQFESKGADGFVPWGLQSSQGILLIPRKGSDPV